MLVIKPCKPPMAPKVHIRAFEAEDCRTFRHASPSVTDQLRPASIAYTPSFSKAIRPTTRGDTTPSPTPTLKLRPTSSSHDTSDKAPFRGKLKARIRIRTKPKREVSFHCPPIQVTTLHKPDGFPPGPSQHLILPQCDPQVPLKDIHTRNAQRNCRLSLKDPMKQRSMTLVVRLKDQHPRFGSCPVRTSLLYPRWPRDNAPIDKEYLRRIIPLKEAFVTEQGVTPNKDTPPKPALVTTLHKQKKVKHCQVNLYKLCVVLTLCLLTFDSQREIRTQSKTFSEKIEIAKTYIPIR